MSYFTRSHFAPLIAIAVGSALIASCSEPYQSQSPTEKQYNSTVYNADRSKHTSQGGTRPGMGTYGHSSATTPSNPGATQAIQVQQQSLPATPSHSSTWK